MAASWRDQMVIRLPPTPTTQETRVRTLLWGDDFDAKKNPDRAADNGDLLRLERAAVSLRHRDTNEAHGTEYALRPETHSFTARPSAGSADLKASEPADARHKNSQLGKAIFNSALGGSSAGAAKRDDRSGTVGSASTSAATDRGGLSRKPSHASQSTAASGARRRRSVADRIKAIFGFKPREEEPE